MRRFAADLHVHSRFSRATSKSLTIRNLAAFARLKGLDLVATGDATHPKWLAEIEATLVEEGDGLLRLADPRGLGREVPGFSGPVPGDVRFVLQAEISSIYKRAGAVRKVHNLVFLPGLDAARRFNAVLSRIGNLASDGRPILGLDSRDLLEIVLGLDPQAFLVPAHIWTPLFSLFGSKSGFDSIEECFGGLSGEIFAMETGLSSDPAMNWTLSALDRIRLISNSDAHSGEKLGREANLFAGAMGFAGLRRALRGEPGDCEFLGTLEFFPEEGKYHLDGHRKCGVVFEPRESRARGGLCPVCGRPLTLGVLSRVTELADRDAPVRPPGMPGFFSLIPLREVVGEVLDVGPASRKVDELYFRLLADLGPELAILKDVPLEDVRRHSALLAEALGRMREGRVLRKAGFDGEYGTISVFSPEERAALRHGGRLAAGLAPRREAGAAPAEPQPSAAPVSPRPEAEAWNPGQQEALAAGPGPVLVLAGPGTGKTRPISVRVERLLAGGEPASRILVLTLTRRAAGEVRERLVARLGEGAELPKAATLHAHAYDLWSQVRGKRPVLLDEESARRVFAEANPGLDRRAAARVFERCLLAREGLAEPEAELLAAAESYVRLKQEARLADYADLLEFLLARADSGGPAVRPAHLLVDEVQDLSRLQLAAVLALAGEGGRGFFAIGDPRQSIYGFRGAVGDVRAAIEAAWPALRVVTLADNYRSGRNILTAAAGLFPGAQPLKAVRGIDGSVHLFEAPDAQAEAAWIAGRIRGLIGATSHTLADAAARGDLAPGDVAVMVRFKGLIPGVVAALGRQGVPCSAPETEAFFVEPRVAAILRAAERRLGVPGAAAQEGGEIEVPEAALAGGPQRLPETLARQPGFDDFFWRGKAFRELVAAYGAHGGWEGLVGWVGLESGLEAVRLKAETVQVMSLHAAKGLEFKAVFLPALEDGIVPFAGTGALLGQEGGREPADAEEERRLFYVGLTRAGDELYLSRAARRTLYGRELALPASRFLRDIPANCLTRSSLVARTAAVARQASLFGPG